VCRTIGTEIVISECCKDYPGSNFEKEHVVHIPSRPRYLGEVLEGAPAIGAAGDTERMLAIWKTREGGEDGAVRESSQAGIGAIVGRGREWALIVVDEPATW
jgi:hypothetical protein